MKPRPSLEHRAVLKSFDEWIRVMFNAQGLFRKPVPFCCAPHIDAEGNVTIDRGRMILEFPDEQNSCFTLFVVSDGARMILSCYDSLEQVLMAGLQHSLARSFANSYRP